VAHLLSFRSGELPGKCCIDRLPWSLSGKSVLRDPDYLPMIFCPFEEPTQMRR
jgi:hypothetical protein